MNEIVQSNQTPQAPGQLPVSVGNLIQSAYGSSTVRRAVERAAVKELLAAKKDQYAQEDAEDRAAIERLRHEHGEAIAVIEGQQRAQLSEHAAQLACLREGWSVAHERTGKARAAARTAIAADRAEHGPLDREALAGAKAQRDAVRQSVADERSGAVVREGLELADLRDPWSIAHERTVVAKRAMDEAIKAERAEHASKRAERKAAREAARHALAAADDERFKAIQAAQRDHALAESLWREAVREKADAEAIAELRAKANEAAAQVKALVEASRIQHNADQEALRQRTVSEARERGLAQMELRRAWVEAADQEREAKRALRDAEKAAREAAKPAKDAAAKEQAARLKAGDETFAEATGQIRRAKGLREAEINAAHLELAAAERLEKARLHTAEAELAGQHREADKLAAKAAREARNAADSALASAAREIKQRRAAERKRDRDAVLAAIDEVYRGMELSSGTPKPEELPAAE